MPDYLVSAFACFILLASCTGEKPVEHKPAPVSTPVVKQKPRLLSSEERTALKFSQDVIAMVETAADAKAEPFFATVVMKTANLKGGEEIEAKKLAGFSVRTTRSDEIIAALRSALKAKRCLIFKSQNGYGSLPDIVTVIRGNNSYDIIKVQGTEAANRQIETKEIIKWLKARQKDAPFVIIGAGTDWVEGSFIKSPKDMTAFAREVAEFAPDVLARDMGSVTTLAKRMVRTNGFYLSWD